MAELLHAHGHEVELMTSCEKVAPMCDETLEGPILRRHLHDLGIGMQAEAWLTRIDAGRRRRRDGARRDVRRSRRTPSCSSPSVSPTRRSTSSWRPTGRRWPRRGSSGVYRIGDCVAPRLIADAIWDGHRLGREIDSPDPASPLPHLRERPGLDADPLTAVR